MSEIAIPLIKPLTRPVAADVHTLLGRVVVPPPPIGFAYLKGAEGAYLKGADGAYLLGAA